jgi:HEAT repeat protein
VHGEVAVKSLHHPRSFVRPGSLVGSVSVALLLLVAAPAALAQAGAAASAEEGALVAELETKRDEADAALVQKIAACRTASAAKALVDAYPKLGSIWMRREVLRGLGEFESVPGGGTIALDLAASVAGSAIEPELRDAAFETLTKCRQLGHSYLARLVEAPVQEQVKERALELHAASGGGPDDLAWYKKLYADEKLPRKLRETAFTALAKNLENADVVRHFKEARDGTIRRIALEALQARGAPGVGDLALETLRTVNALATDRAAAAKVLAAAKGPKAADDLIGVALQQATTPELLRETLAELLGAMKDESTNKKLVGLLGKGKPHEQRFALLAVRPLLEGDEKLAKKVRSQLDDKDPEVRRVVIRVLGERKDVASADALEKLLAKPKDPGDSASIIAALSRIKAGDAAWEVRLEQLATDPARDRRNAALQALAEKGDKKHVPLFTASVAHEDWSTRLIALAALEELRDRDSLGAIVAQMQKESGRELVEFGNALFRLTGELHDVDAATWQKWWNDVGKDLPLLEPADLEKRVVERERKRLRQSTTARFFGVKIESHDVAFVVDVSGSMAEQLESTVIAGRAATRMEVVKQELVKSLKALDSAAFFNLITFNAAVTRWRDGVAPLDDKTRAEAVEYVEHLGSRGGTNIYDALEAAFSDPKVDTIFLLTDGDPTAGNVVDAQLIREHVARWNATRHVKIHCVGVGADFPLLEWLASDSGGTYTKFS